MSNGQDFIEFGSPVGRYVQGSFSLQDEKDDQGKVKLNDDGTVSKSVIFVLAFEKTNPEWPGFKAQILGAGATFWPQFHPQGPTGPRTHPSFSDKIIDGDGFDANGKNNAEKPGFAGHWLVRFKTSYVPKVHFEGKFLPHEVIPNPDEVVKRGFYLRVIGIFKSNKATGTQKPGIAIYPNFVSFVRQGVEIVSGVKSDEAFAKFALGAVPTTAGAAPLAHPGSVAAPVVTPPVVAAPVVVAPPVQAPVIVAPVVVAGPQLSDSFLAQYPGMTVEAVQAQGHTIEAMRGYGWLK